jgi:hypothetical protein
MLLDDRNRLAGRDLFWYARPRKSTCSRYFWLTLGSFGDVYLDGPWGTMIAFTHGSGLNRQFLIKGKNLS